MKILIIGKGKVGQATAQSMNCEVDYHDPYKGYVVSNYNTYNAAIVCVDTLRQGPSDHKDLNDVLVLLRKNKFKGIVAIRCTISPKFLKTIVKKFNDLRIVLFPEFMRQTDDLKMDTPWIVVLGGDSKDTNELKHILVESKYCTTLTKYHLVSLADACIIKLCQNAGLATKVIFFNMVNEVCEKYGATYENVRIGVGADERVGIQYSIVPSPDDGKKGFKGHCLPKDVRCLSSIEKFNFFKTLISINKKLGRS